MKPEKLIKYAIKAQKRAHAKYSDFPVGAAILCNKDVVVLGCNIESKAYPSTMCAERVAIYSAISMGISDFKALAIVSNIGAKPCGPCRQIIHEYLHNIPIYTSNGKKLDDYEEYRINELLPHAFG
ncbi:MAG: cytidine deaminase [Candidatus Marinimicrobia bacterium]|nr:cytidine deaminase [Candidatus Neomarinimicrobiota bacterium]|tara:strand:+ start:147 stop:524 length:378 start_codon:yes stop_codon:yes gene_type:complete